MLKRLINLAIATGAALLNVAYGGVPEEIGVVIFWVVLCCGEAIDIHDRLKDMQRCQY